MTTSDDIAEPILSVDIGGHQFAVAVCSSDGEVFDAERVRTELRADAGEIANGVLVGVERLQQRLPDLVAQIRRAGVGFGGPVSPSENRPHRSLHVAGWDQIDLCALLEERFGWPSRMFNDADAAAVGEYRFGAGVTRRLGSDGSGARGDSLVYLTVSTGIGGGIVLNGRLWRGAHGLAGELGHIRIADDGPKCACGGVGCLESLCSGTALGRVAAEAARRQPLFYQEVLSRVGGKPESVTAQAVFDTAAAGDRAASDLLDEYIDNLARGVGSILNAFDPDVLVIGGGVAKAGDTLFRPLRRRVRKYVMPMLAAQFRVEPAVLAGHAVLLGAAALAVEE